MYLFDQYDATIVKTVHKKRRVLVVKNFITRLTRIITQNTKVALNILSLFVPITFTIVCCTYIDVLPDEDSLWIFFVTVIGLWGLSATWIFKQAGIDVEDFF